MKRPSFQFYPADWRKDAALQSCSMAAQGLWVNVMCIAHECEPYGHLVVNGKAMSAAQIARLVGLGAGECAKLLAELEAAGVTSKTDDGAIFSRRMVRDEDIRERRAAGGKGGAEHGFKGAEHGRKGGRPKTGRGVSEPPLEPPPSSSSSSSASAVIPSVGVPTGAVAPQQQGSLIPIELAEPKPMTARERVWAMGVALLGESARGLLGKLSKAYGEEALAAVLAQATLDRPAEPKAWVVAACEARKSAPTKANGHDAKPGLLDDPTPEWALQAGFQNRFLAENEGCNRHNAAKFRDGRRIAQ